MRVRTLPFHLASGALNRAIARQRMRRLARVPPGTLVRSGSGRVERVPFGSGRERVPPLTDTRVSSLVDATVEAEVVHSAARGDTEMFGNYRAARGDSPIPGARARLPSS